VGVAEKLTLDTNVVREHWSERAKLEVVEMLVELAERGEAELAVTRYIRDDVPGGVLATRINDLAAELSILETGGVFTLDESCLDGPDGLGDQEFVDFQHALGPDWRPKRGKAPDRRDWLHLHAHLIQRRDVFLTWDRGLLELGEKLKAAGFAITVARPEDYLARG
jgi:hypothetical protein